MVQEKRGYATGLRKAVQLAFVMFPLIGVQAKAASVPILGVGATTPCSSWRWARSHPPAANDLQNWVLGYFSGQAMGMAGSFLIGSDADTLYAGLDTQCLVTPNSSVADAVDVLVMRFKEGI